MDAKVEADRISDLHESIVGRILSSLPTQEAVRTSILSKTWKHKWRAISDVRISSRCFHWDSRLMEFMENLFRSVGNSQLRTFHFNSDVCEAEKGQFEYILTILRRNLEELKLSVRTTLLLSPAYPMSNLKTLDLQRVKIVSDESSHFFLHFPSLKGLTLACCEWMDFAKISIDSPILETLQIEDCWYNNETSSASESGYCVFNLMAPHLHEFIYTGAFYEEFLLSNPSSVSRARIKFTTWTGLNPRTYDSGYGLLASFSNLKHQEPNAQKMCYPFSHCFES